MKRRIKMTKYGVRWCRIWEFREEIEAETEKEAYERILEERATAGSTIEILSVWHISLEGVKQEAKEEDLYDHDKGIDEMEAEKRAKKKETTQDKRKRRKELV